MKRHFWGRRTLAAVLVLALVLAGIAAGSILFERSQLREQEQALTEESEKVNNDLWSSENKLWIDHDIYAFDHRLETFLFIGTDLGGGQPIGNSGKTRQPMADFLLLMILDHTQNTIAYLQIDRNTVTQVQDLNAEGDVLGARDLQICTAHWYGSTPEMAAENTVEAVRYYLGDMDHIDGYYVISMDDLELLNRAVGGVQITLDESLPEVDPAFTEGATLTLTDVQAEAYIRARMEAGTGSNTERMARQRNYMNGLFAKIRERCAADPQFALTLFDTLRKAACTTLNGNDFSRIAQKLLKGESKGIHTIGGTVRQGYLANADEAHEEFVPDRASLKRELIELFSLVPVPDEDDEDYEEGELIPDEEDEEAEEGELIPDGDDEEAEEGELIPDEEDEDAEEGEPIPEEDGGEPESGKDGNTAP